MNIIHTQKESVTLHLVITVCLCSSYPQVGWIKACAFIFSCENSKIATNCWTTINRRMLDPTKRRYPMSKGKGGSPKDGRRGDFIPAIPARDAWRAQTKPCTSKNPETTQRLSQNCVWESPVVVQVNSGLLQGQELPAQWTWVWHKPSWRRLPLTPPKSQQNLHRTEEIDSWKVQTKLSVHQTQEKGTVTLQETDPDLPMSVQECLVEAWVSSGLLQGWGHWV